jgi:TetR/AcrR family transcriptional regulator, regulator of cefoperazone and chloramphenicol sensitivity
VSTRDIATAAETTLPSIPHHFGSKQGLYRAVLSAISEEIAARIEPASKQATEVLCRKSASKTERAHAIELLIDTHARALLEGKREWAKLILFEQLQPTDALAPINQVLRERLIDPIVGLLVTLTAVSVQDAKLKTLSLLGRVMVFRAGRGSALHLMGWDDLTPNRINKILGVLRAEVRASIGA